MLWYTLYFNFFPYRCLYFTTKSNGYVITCDEQRITCSPFSTLSSNQEEADTKVFLAAKVAQDLGCSDVAIFTVDSDVAMLACYYSQLLTCRLYLQIGTGANLRILNIGNNEWSESVLKALPSLHAISGCDAVSAVNGIGKGKWLSTAQKKDIYLEELSTLGESIDIDESTFKVLEQLFCHLYGVPEKSEINEVRYIKFCKENVPEPNKLPPTEDELRQHIKRANYQAFVWKRALDVNPNIPSPVGNGWCLTENCLEVKWMENRPAPDAVLELVTCSCRKSNCNESCQCRMLSMECTDVCKCQAKCQNIVYDSESENEDDEDDDEISNY